MSISKTCNSIFQQVIDDYRLQNFVDANKNNPYDHSNFFKKMIYDKCWIDTIQWHLEDIIRVPDIRPDEALKIKRRIDLSNQHRTDMVEELDDYFFEKYTNSNPSKFLFSIFVYDFFNALFISLSDDTIDNTLPPLVTILLSIKAVPA